MDECEEYYGHNSESAWMMAAVFSEGQTFEVTRAVTEGVYQAFVMCSGDENPLHADDEYARKLGYPGKLMHGAILNAFISGFVGMALPTPDTMCLSQKVSFRRPFFLNDVVTLRAKVESVQGAPQPQKWIVSMALSFRVGDKLVATGDVEVLVGS